VTEHRWLLSEPSFRELPRQLAGLFRRGVRRPLGLGLGCACLALLLLASLALLTPRYAPRVVLRVLESDRDPTSTPALKRQLGEYVREGVLTAEPLLEIRSRYGLYPHAADRTAALAAFRRDIDVDVYRNYFVEARAAGDQPRSARVMVSYRAGDRETALAVTRDLASLIVGRVEASRRDQSERASLAAGEATRSLEDSLAERYARLAQVRVALRSAPEPELEVELVSLLGSIATLERRLDAATKRQGAVDLGAASEKFGVGLRFEVAEDAAVPLFNPHSRLRELALVLMFISGFPFVVLAAGAGALPRGSS
jgi:hypothetical protein